MDLTRERGEDALRHGRRVALTTLGCKLNQYETNHMQELFEKRGYHVVPFDEEADVYVVNTCTVTAKSDYRSRQLLRRAARRNPQALVVGVGCYPQVSPDDVARVEGVDLVLGNAEKMRITDYLDGPGKQAKPRVCVGDIAALRLFEEVQIETFTEHTRAFMKIQDGCNLSCSYCIITKARGQNRSQRPGEVLQQARRLVQQGYTEIVLTGVHLGTYGNDLGEITLAGILRRLAEVPGVRKIRISSVEPSEFSEDLFGVIVHESKVAKHLHIPMQSGDDTILKKMRRPYRSRNYRDLILRLKEAVPEMGIGADVIVGYPGETDEQFRSTCSLVEKLPLTYLHVFNYSNREGTRAAADPDQVPPEIRKERSEKMRELGLRKARAFKERYLGETVTILVESNRDKSTGLLKGLTDNYIQVFAPGEDNRMNDYHPVRVAQVTDEYMVGEFAPQ